MTLLANITNRTMQDLQKLLKDLTSAEPQELENIVNEIAVCLLRQTKIVTPKEQFHLREIEFYYYDAQKHPDPYTHKRPRQALFGEWYFHRFKNVSAFLKSNRNGIDITFGNQESNLFGGILIRKIENIRTGELIVGINKVVRELIKDIPDVDVDSMVIGTGQIVFDRQQPLHLEVNGNSYSSAIYKTQRYGLSYKDNELAQDYYKRPYCYYNHNLNVKQIIEVRSAI